MTEPPVVCNTSPLIKLAGVGTPGTVEEAQELRAASQRNRRADQQRRRTRRSNGTAEHQTEPADTTAADAGAPETDDEQPEA